MAYEKQNFKNGDILNADQLNNIENGIQSVAASIPTELKNPEPITFTGGYTGSYDGSVAKTVPIPTIPTAIKNPNKLTINIGSQKVEYDGSSAQTVTIEDGNNIAY